MGSPVPGHEVTWFHNNDTNDWRPYVNTNAFIARTGARIILPEDWPTHFAIREDQPVTNGGRHEYHFRTLHCARHGDPAKGRWRSGCGRPAPMDYGTLYGFKRRAYEATLHRLIMGQHLVRAYLTEFDVEEGDWLPSWIGF